MVEGNWCQRGEKFKRHDPIHSVGVLRACSNRKRTPAKNLVGCTGGNGSSTSCKRSGIFCRCMVALRILKSSWRLSEPFGGTLHFGQPLFLILFNKTYSM